jgi:hypothetical protein
VLHGVDWAETTPQALAALADLDLATITPTLVHLAGQIGRGGFTAGHAAALAAVDPTTIPPAVRTALSRVDVQKLTPAQLAALAEADPTQLTIEKVAAFPQREDLPPGTDPAQTGAPETGTSGQDPAETGQVEPEPSLATLGASMLSPAGPANRPAPAVETESPAETTTTSTMTTAGATPGSSGRTMPTPSTRTTSQPAGPHPASRIMSILDGPAPGPSGPLAGGRGVYFGTSSDDPATLHAAVSTLPLFTTAFVVAAHTTADGQRVVLPTAGRRPPPSSPTYSGRNRATRTGKRSCWSPAAPAPPTPTAGRSPPN